MALVAITRERERWYRRSKGQLQDVRTFIPKDPEMARSTESLCPSTKPWPQSEPPWGADQITCTMMNLYFCRLDKCNSGHCWGSAGDGLMWVGCRCECKTFIQLRAPPTLLVFKLRPHFFHCSSFVLIQKSLFGESTPVNWSLSSRHNDRLSLIVFSLCTVRICTTYTSHLHYQHTMDMKVKISALWWLTKKRRAYSHMTIWPNPSLQKK